MALKQDGSVVAWGDNRFGQSTVPNGLTGVIAIATGIGWNSCQSLALRQDGTVVAWGSILSKDGSQLLEATVPDGLTNVIAIAAGGVHCLALVRQPPLKLQLQVSSNNLRLSWPAEHSTAILESARAFNDSTLWIPVSGSGNPRTVTIGSGDEFFRLRIP